MTVSLCQFTDR